MMVVNKSCDCSVIDADRLCFIGMLVNKSVIVL